MVRKEIGEILGYSEPTKAISNIHLKNEKLFTGLFRVEKVSSTDGKKYNSFIYNKQGIIEICKLSSKGKEAKRKLLEVADCSEEEIALVIGSNNRLYKQESLFEMLTETFKGICTIEREVRIQGVYRADFLISNKIVVECDELGHKHYNQEAEVKREQTIKNEGYEIIRFNPESDTYANLTNRLLKRLLAA